LFLVLALRLFAYFGGPRLGQRRSNKFNSRKNVCRALRRASSRVRSSSRTETFEGSASDLAYAQRLTDCRQCVYMLSNQMDLLLEFRRVHSARGDIDALLTMRLGYSDDGIAVQYALYIERLEEK
jgi:hypothetical protein